MITCGAASLLNKPSPNFLVLNPISGGWMFLSQINNKVEMWKYSLLSEKNTWKTELSYCNSLLHNLLPWSSDLNSTYMHFMNNVRFSQYKVLSIIAWTMRSKLAYVTHRWSPRNDMCAQLSQMKMLKLLLLSIKPSGFDFTLMSLIEYMVVPGQVRHSGTRPVRDTNQVPKSRYAVMRQPSDVTLLANSMIDAALN